MRNGRVASAALALIAALSVPSAAQEARINPFAQRLLAEHNQARDAVGVPRLAWSARLAGEAQQWAEHLAQQGRMEHSSREGRGGAGENLWAGTAGRYGADRMVGAFVAERQYFRNGMFPRVSTTGNWSDVGHYTQVVWRETQEVGCAVARGEQWDFLVCRYWPAGNTYDRAVF
ncbi:MAG: SCP-like extracellular [Erythrobacter sp.]|nr:SCP-like extracellular [Erythrobacter sp.]